MKYFIVLLAGFVVLASCVYAQDTSGKKMEQSSDQTVQDLKNERDVAARRAYIASDKADRAMDRNWLDYKRYLREKEYYEGRVKELDKKIDALEKK